MVILKQIIIMFCLIQRGKFEGDIYGNLHLKCHSTKWIARWVSVVNCLRILSANFTNLEAFQERRWLTSLSNVFSTTKLNINDIEKCSFDVFFFCFGALFRTYNINRKGPWWFLTPVQPFFFSVKYEMAFVTRDTSLARC